MIHQAPLAEAWSSRGRVPAAAVRRVDTVIFDWAGTTVDCGSIAPVAAFLEGFRRRGVSVSVAEARGPMGVHKGAHLMHTGDAAIADRFATPRDDRRPRTSMRCMQS